MDDDLNVPDDIDFSGFEAQGDSVQAEETSTVEAEADSQTPGVNPAWNEYLKDVPESLRPLVTPAFESWDKGVQEQFVRLKSQFEPFKRFQEREIDPEYLDRAYDVAQRLQNDPVAIYQSLHQYFQQSPQHLQQLQQLGLLPTPPEEKAAPNGNLEPEDPIAALQQEIEQLKYERLQELQEAQVAQEFNQEYERTVTAIETDFNAIEAKTGNLPANVKAEIIKQAQVMGQQQQRYVSVVEAAPHVFRFIQQARAGMKSAPRPVGSGSVPQSSSFDPTTASDDERAARIAQIVQQHAGN